MILSDKIEIKCSNNQISYWREKGYETKGNNELISVFVNDLPKNSGQKIKVSCDFCGNQKEISLNRYNINTKNGKTYYSCSRKCSEQKNKNTLNEKYGVNNISQLNEIKIKKIETCLLNNSVKYPMQSGEILEKSKKTKLKNYNDENYNNTQKRIETCLVKYGFKTPCECESIKQKLKKSKYTKEQITELCKEKHNGIYSYLDFDFENVRSDIKAVCEKHGEFEQKIYKHRQGQGCPVCNESKGEKNIRNFLENNNILFESQKKFNDFNYPFDFYLPNLNILIEYDGIQHFEPVEIFGGEKSFIKQKKNDNLKNAFCLDNNIKLLRIPYFEDEIDILKTKILNEKDRTV